MMNEIAEMLGQLEDQARVREISQMLEKIGFKGFRRVQFEAGLEFASREAISDEKHKELTARFKALYDEFCGKLEVVAKEVIGEANYAGVEELQPLLDKAQQQEFETGTVDESPFCGDPECVNCASRRAALGSTGRLN